MILTQQKQTLEALEKTNEIKGLIVQKTKQVCEAETKETVAVGAVVELRQSVEKD